MYTLIIDYADLVLVALRGPGCLGHGVAQYGAIIYLNYDLTILTQFDF